MRFLPMHHAYSNAGSQPAGAAGCSAVCTAAAGPPPSRLDLALPHCRVRPWRHSDAESLARHLNDRCIWMYTRNRIPHPYTLEHAREFLEAVTDPEGPAEAFAIEVGGEAAGGLGIHLQDDVYCRSAELGFWLGRQHWGRGIASEAVAAAIDSAWERLPDLHRIVARCYEHNAGSQALLRKLGFQQEGCLRQAAWKDGQFRDELVFGLLRHEWEQQALRQQALRQQAQQQQGQPYEYH